MASSATLENQWVDTTLGKLGRYMNGRAFKTSEWSKTGRPIIRIQDLTGSNRNPNYFNGHIEHKYIVRPGDLLISWSATLGAYIWDGPEAVLNQHIFKVESRIDKRFHYHLVRGCIAQLLERTHGSGMVHVTRGVFDSTPVRIPRDPTTQRRIAAFIDQVDLKRSAVSKHIVASQEAIERLRQAVLAAAYAQAEAESVGEGRTPLREILREPLKNGYSAQPVSYETPYRVVTLTATTSGVFDERHFKYTDKQFPDDSEFWLAPGDVVVQRGNTAEYVGVAAVYEGPSNELLYPDLMIRVRVRRDIEPRFLWYMLLAPQARNFLRDRATGSAGNMPKINQSILGQVPIPVGTADSRRRIVESLDRILALADVVKTRLDLTGGALGRSSQAVLSKVLRGELVETNGVNGLRHDCERRDVVAT